jgi:uncharacterized protein (TIGR03435 family)
MRRSLLVTGSAVALAATLLTAPRPHAQSFSAPAGSVPAPDPNVPLYFEAATIKPSDPKAPPGSGIRRQPGGRFSTINAPLRMLVTFAFQIQNYQLVAPGWIADDRYDIVAKMEGDPPPVIPGTGADHMMLATRTLLADRFKMKMHRETREMDIYALVMAKPGGKPGPALNPAGDACKAQNFAGRGAPAPGAPPPPVCGVQMVLGRIRFGGYPLSLFTSAVSGQLGRFVIDRTGLEGNWDFELTYTPEQRGTAPPGADLPTSDPNGPSLFTAVQEQLGLKFEATKGPVDVIVIDSIEKPTPD